MNAEALPPADIPTTMRAALLMGHGGPEMLQVRDDVPVPKPAPDEVLIKVAACGMNNTDINTRIGWYNKAITGATDDAQGTRGDDNGTWGDNELMFPRIQGADPCGRVVAVGDDVDDALIGKRVLADCWIRDPRDPSDRTKAGYIGSERDGGFAEYCTAPARNVHVQTSTLSDIELASIPCSWSTAEHMLQRVRLTRGQHIVVTGASGGVGSALIQLAKLRGAHVTAICGTAKMEQVAQAGADQVVARDLHDVPAAAMAAANGTFDVVADVVGGSDFVGWLESLRRGGRYVTAGAIAGPVVELDLRTLYLNDLELYGTTIYEPHVFSDLMSYIEQGKIRPMVGGTFPLEQIHIAQQAFLDKTHVGALVITL